MPRKLGDRKDGKLIRDVDSMHFIMPIIYPNRCDNEAFLSELIDLTRANEYLAKKNAEGPAYKYNLFQLVVTSLLKVITLRPKMNRFIANSNLYQRNDVSAAFTMKKIFTDDGEEGLCCLVGKPEDTIDTIHEEMYRQISTGRSGKVDSSTESMDTFNKLPRFISKTAVKAITVLDRHGKVPSSLIETDPYYRSVVISNLGSIKLHAGYHHLTNWGTTSVFCVIGEMKDRAFHDAEGNVEMRPSVDLTLTIDERIADGYYYSKTVRLLKTLLENPELLEKPLAEEVDY